MISVSHIRRLQIMCACLTNAGFFFCNLETLKKQASQQNAEYGRLADEHNKAVSYIFKFFYGI